MLNSISSCLILAGEKSGEEHAMTFFPDLKKLCPSTSFWGVGGDELKNLDCDLIYHFKEFSSMGFSEVVGKIPFYYQAMKRIESEIKLRNTKVAILIDFQDFNLRLAGKLSKNGVKVLYYVAPQAWAWKPGRARKIAEYVHTLFTILPFEKEWFNHRGVGQVISVPHPLIERFKDDLQNIKEKKFGAWEKKLKILLLPGSRSFEVKELLPIFIQTITELKKKFTVEVHLVKVQHLNQKYYDPFLSEIDVLYDSDQLSLAMKTCHFSFAASGTVTLATGIYEIPTIVCYKASLLNEFIFKNFINYQGPISLTNIVSSQNVFPELIQDEVSSNKILRTLNIWMENQDHYNRMINNLSKIKYLLKGDTISIPEYMARVINE